MAKTIAVIGTIDNPKVQEYISKEVSLFTNETICFTDLQIDANSFISATDGKITSEQIAEYVVAMANTNIKYKYNIGLISDFELLSVANQNKLLKTIEDSADNTIQIIICKTEQKLINTIKSRVIIVDMRSEELDYDCLDNERPFFENIIKNQAELNYLQENQEMKTSLVALYNYARNNHYEQAFIIYTTMFKEYNKVLNQLVMRILLQTLYEKQQIKKVKELLEYEERLFFNLNERLQIESMFVEIIKEKNG